MADPWTERWAIVRPLVTRLQRNVDEVGSTTDPSKRAVLKRLRDPHPKVRSAMARGVRTTQLLASAGANVPRVIEHNTDQFEDDEVELYEITEWIEGVPLNELVAAGKLTLPDWIRLALALCKAIEILHNKDIIHGDLKPANIMVRDLSKGDAVIIDYDNSFTGGETDRQRDISKLLRTLEYCLSRDHFTTFSDYVVRKRLKSAEDLSEDLTAFLSEHALER